MTTREIQACIWMLNYMGIVDLQDIHDCFLGHSFVILLGKQWPFDS
jgi:hypothetical protein